MAKAARDGLCAVYRRVATARLRAQPSCNVLPDVLAIIPQCLLHCYMTDAAKSAEARLELEALLMTKLLPSDEDLRLRAVCAVHHALKPMQRKALRGLLRAKRILQGEVQRWLELHGAQRSQEATAQEKAAAKEEQAKLIGVLASRMPDAAKAREMWQQIGECKDQKVHKQLAVISSAASSYAELLAAQKELRERMSTRLKDAQKPLLEGLGALTSMALLTPEGTETLLDEIIADLGTNDPARCQGNALRLLELLADVGTHSPDTFATSGSHLATALAAAVKSNAANGSPGRPQASRRPALLGLLGLVHAASLQLARAAPAVRKSIVAVLCQLCCNAKDVEIGKRAAQGLSTVLLVPSVRARTFETLVAKLSPSLDLSQPTAAQPCSLAVLAALAKRDPEALGAGRHGLLSHLCDAALPDQADVRGGATAAGAKRGTARLSAPQLDERVSAQLLAIKLLANETLGNAGLLGSGSGTTADGGIRVPLSSSASSSASAESPGAAASARAATLVKRLLAALDADGAVGAAAEAGEEEQARLRLTAACALLKIARVSHLKAEALMGPHGWHRLCQCMHDPDASVRSSFAKKLAAEQMRPFLADKRDTKMGSPSGYVVSRTRGLPPQYMTLLALAAVDPDKLIVKSAKLSLVQLVTKWRAAAEHNKKTIDTAARAMPEVQLPWLIHCLAYHPNYDDEEKAMDDEEGEDSTLPTAQRCLDFYINACLANGANGFDLLRHVCNQVKVAVDRLSPQGRETRLLACVARALVQYRGEKAKWSATPIPPNLTLPVLLYCRPSEMPMHADVELLPTDFKFVDGLRTSSHGFGHAGVGAHGADRPSTALVTGAKRKAGCGSPPSKGKGKEVSLVRASGSASRRRKGAKEPGDGADGTSDGEESGSEHESDDEGGLREMERAAREEQQRCDREARLAKRAARDDSTALTLPEPDPAAKRGRSAPLALPAPKSARSATAAVVAATAGNPPPRKGAAMASTENVTPNPTTRGQRTARRAR